MNGYILIDHQSGEHVFKIQNRDELYPSTSPETKLKKALHTTSLAKTSMELHVKCGHAGTERLLIEMNKVEGIFHLDKHEHTKK